MKFKEGDRVHVVRFDGEKVNFYATLTDFYFDSYGKTAELVNCSNATFEGESAFLPNDEDFGLDKEDYYTLATDEEDTEEPVIQHINDMYNEVPKEKEQKQKVELKKQYIIEVKKGLYVDYVDSKEAFYFTKDITKACVFKNREYPTKFAEIIDAKILEIKRYVEV